MPAPRHCHSEMTHLFRLPVIITLLGCNRYEYLQPGECPPPPATRSAISWQPSKVVGVVEGSVVTIDSARPIPDAAVVVNGVSRARTSADGSFRIDSLDPG